MLVSARDTLSTESIRHRANTKLFSDVVSAFDTIRKNDTKLTNLGKKNQRVVDDSKIESLVKGHTGLSIRFKTGTDIGINAYVLPPHLDKNHPLLSDTHRQYYSNNDAKKRIKAAKSAIHGEIDLTTGIVKGVYSKINSEIFVAAQILQGDLFTNEEAAAIFLHEVGHLMSYYEYLGRNVLLNHVLEDVREEYTKTQTAKSRVELLKVVSHGLDLSDANPESAEKATKESTFTSLIVSELVRETHSATNTKYYDLRTWEALADQYVSRLGGGRHLALGLDKIHRLYGVRGYESNVIFLISEAFSIFFSIAFLPFTLLFMAMIDMPFDIYDPPKDRIERIRRDMVAEMKNPNLEREYRRRIKDDIKVVDDLIDGIEDRRSIFTSVWATLRPSLKRQFNRAKLVQELESLKDNDLFIRYNELKTIEA